MTEKCSARQEALALGRKHFEGKTCSHCGTSEHFTNNGACCECNRRKCREWYREMVRKPSAPRRCPAVLPVAHSDFIRPIPLARLMAGR